MDQSQYHWRWEWKIKSTIFPSKLIPNRRYPQMLLSIVADPTVCCEWHDTAIFNFLLICSKCLLTSNSSMRILIMNSNFFAPSKLLAVTNVIAIFHIRYHIYLVALILESIEISTFFHFGWISTQTNFSAGSLPRSWKLLIWRCCKTSLNVILEQRSKKYYEACHSVSGDISIFQQQIWVENGSLNIEIANAINNDKQWQAS